MDPAVIQRLEDSFNLLAPRGDELVHNFYMKLFTQNRNLRPMFPKDGTEQKKKLLASIVLVMQNIRTPEKLESPLKDLGAKHHQYNVQLEHYGVVRDVLIETMADMAGNVWNSQLTEDWTGALNFVASIMIEGQKAEAAKTGMAA